MEYNVDREPLIIPEYGRHIQKMVNYCVEIENTEERNRCANAIISVMGDMNPHLRDVPDFQHKLWDQLFIMSRFKLDVDSPFEKPTPEKFTERPRMLEYPYVAREYRYYGQSIKKMIEVAINWEVGEKKEGLIYAIANHMKKCYLKWNKDTVDDNTIWNHLDDLSEGKLRVSNPEALIEGTSYTPNRNFQSNRPQQNNNNGASKKNNNRPQQPSSQQPYQKKRTN